MENKKTAASILALAALLTLVGFVATGLRLYAALDETSSRGTPERAFRKPSAITTPIQHRT